MFAVVVVFGPVIAGLVYDQSGDYFYAGFLTGGPLILACFVLIKMLLILREEEKLKKLDDEKRELLHPAGEDPVADDEVTQDTAADDSSAEDTVAELDTTDNEIVVNNTETGVINSGEGQEKSV